ncbi:MAG: hypothetical protein M1438_18960 [Deltaproteobacteria bacterium]|nr:hypothetical protein [Deltaproteobacteria bacterium]
MVRRKAKVGPAQKLTGYAILALLGLIIIGMLFRQAHFNPAVKAALRTPISGKIQTASSQAPAATAALLPEVGGFTPLAPVESFGPDNLSDKIDGKAELYLPAGFKEMSCRKFGVDAAGKAYVEVFLYDMGSGQNAFAVFSSQRRPGSPDSPLTANAYTASNALFFTQGRYYVEIVADRASEAMQKSLETYAQALLAKLPAEGGAQTTDAKEFFPKEGLAADTVRLCATDTFCLEGLNNVLTGEYSLKSGKATGFIARRETPDLAQSDAKRYVDFLTANGYQKTEPAPPADFQVLALDNSYEIVFVQGRTMAGVHDATTPQAAVELAAKLKRQLKDAP